MSERAAESETPEFVTKEDFDKLREAQDRLEAAIAKLGKTDPDTARGRKAEREVEKAADEVEEAAEAVGIKEESINAIAERVADKIAAWADEQEEAEKEAKERDEKGALGKLEEGQKPPPEPEATPPQRGAEEEATPPPPPAPEDKVPGKGHWSERRIGRRREDNAA